MTIAILTLGAVMWIALIKVIVLEPVTLYLRERRRRRSAQPMAERPVAVPRQHRQYGGTRYRFPDPTRV